MPYDTQRVGAPYLKRTGASFSLQEDAGVHLAVLGPRAHPFLSENTSPVFVRRFVWVCYALRVSTLLVSHGPSIWTKLAGHSASARYRLRTAPRSRVWSVGFLDEYLPVSKSCSGSRYANKSGDNVRGLPVNGRKWAIFAEHSGLLGYGRVCGVTSVHGPLTSDYANPRASRSVRHLSVMGRRLLLMAGRSRYRLAIEQNAWETQGLACEIRDA